MNIDNLSVDNYVSTSIIHPKYYHFITDHLNSIFIAQQTLGKPIKHYILCSSCNNKQDEQDLLKLVEPFKDLIDLTVEFVFERYTCAKARNHILSKVNAKWIIMWDSDIQISKYYYLELEKLLFGNNININGVGAIGGSIGSSYNSLFGKYEFLMDLYAYYNKIVGFKDAEVWDFRYFSELTEKSPIMKYRSKPILYLQGFNHIINKSIVQLCGGYDNEFFGAEDRDIAANLIQHDYQVIFEPNLLVNHYYNFTLKDFIIRKYNHGYYSEKYRSKHKDLYQKFIEVYKYKIDIGTKKWLKLFKQSIIPHKTFRADPLAYIYNLIAFFPYFFGAMLYLMEFNNFLGYNNIKLYSDKNYSNYSFSSKTYAISNDRNSDIQEREIF